MSEPCEYCDQPFEAHRKFLSSNTKSYCHIPDTRHWYIPAERVIEVAPCMHEWEFRTESWPGGSDTYEVCKKCGVVQDQTEPIEVAPGEYARAEPAQEVEPTCSCTSPHAAHTFGGRPMQYCSGIPKRDEPTAACNLSACDRMLPHHHTGNGIVDVGPAAAATGIGATPATQIPDIEVMRQLAGDNWEPYLINRINVAESALRAAREERYRLQEKVACGFSTEGINVFAATKAEIDTVADWRHGDLMAIQLKKMLKSERESRKQEADMLRELAQGIIDEYSPCDVDETRPRLQWCNTHSTKRCGQKALYEKAVRALEGKRA